MTHCCMAADAATDAESWPHEQMVHSKRAAGCAVAQPSVRTPIAKRCSSPPESCPTWRSVSPTRSVLGWHRGATGSAKHCWLRRREGEAPSACCGARTQAQRASATAQEDVCGGCTLLCAAVRDGDKRRDTAGARAKLLQQLRNHSALVLLIQHLKGVNGVNIGVRHAHGWQRRLRRNFKRRLGARVSGGTPPRRCPAPPSGCCQRTEA